MALLLTAIVIAFAGAFFSLSQDIRVSATGYEMDRLATQKMRLEAHAQDLRNELTRLGKAPAIRKLAIGAGLLSASLALTGMAGSAAPALVAASVMSLGGAAMNAGSNVLVSDTYSRPPRCAPPDPPVTMHPPLTHR